MQGTRVFIHQLTLQKDEFQARENGKPLENAAPWSLEEFTASKEMSTELLQFKRFRIKGSLEHEGRRGEFEVIVSLRGDSVVFTAGKSSPVTSSGLYWLFDNHLQRWNHRRHVNSGYAPNPDAERALLPVDEGIDEHPVRATVRNSLWFTDILHQMRDRKEGTLIETLPPQFIRKPTEPSVSM